MVQSRLEQAYLQAYDSYMDALFKHAVFRVSDREQALDLTQQVFVKTWDFLVEGGTILSYKSFLYRVLNNLIIDYYRKQKNISLDALLEDDKRSDAIEALSSNGSRDEAEESLAAKVDLEKLNQHIAKLTPLYRSVIVLRFVDGLSIREIADILHVDQNLVSVRIHRGIENLRTLYSV